MSSFFHELPVVRWPKKGRRYEKTVWTRQLHPEGREKGFSSLFTKYFTLKVLKRKYVGEFLRYETGPNNTTYLIFQNAKTHRVLFHFQDAFFELGEAESEDPDADSAFSDPDAESAFSDADAESAFDDGVFCLELDE